MNATIIAQRYMRKICYKQLLEKMASKRGKSRVWLTITYNPAWYADGERAAVEEALRAEQKARGLR